MTPNGELTAEDIANLHEVLDSQVRLGHVMTLTPTDVLSRLVRASEARATATPGLDVERLARAMHRSYDRDPNVTRIEWSDLSLPERVIWRNHAEAIEHRRHQVQRHRG